MPKTTARQLVDELNSFSNALEQIGEKLQEEAQNIGASRDQICLQVMDTTKKFVGQTVDSLDSDELVEIDALAISITELTDQSPAYFMQDMIAHRDELLGKANALFDRTYTAEELIEFYDDLGSKFTNAENEIAQIDLEIKKAQSELDTWEAETLEDDLVRLDKKITEANLPALTVDNRDFYEPKNLIAAAAAAATRGDVYREVRELLEKYGHGNNGKDAFADIVVFKEKQAAFEANIQEATTRKENAEEQKNEIEELGDKLHSLVDIMHTDAEILEEVQDKITAYILECPAFTQAIAEHYEEDFPRNIPLMSTKIDALEEQLNGIEEKMNELNADLSDIHDQLVGLQRYQPNDKISDDLDKVKERHEQKRQAYESCREKTHQANESTRSIGGKVNPDFTY